MEDALSCCAMNVSSFCALAVESCMQLSNDCILAAAQSGLLGPLFSSCDTQRQILSALAAAPEADHAGWRRAPTISIDTEGIPLCCFLGC